MTERIEDEELEATAPEPTPTDEREDDGVPGEEPIGPSKVLPDEVDETRLCSILESLIFVAAEPVSAVRLARASRTKVAVVRRVLERIAADYEARGMRLTEVAGGFQFRSAPENGDYVRDFATQRPVRLTRAQLETLAIIGYRQPVTRPEVEEIRGVDSGSALKVLLERELVKIIGRKEEPGRPLMYGTTPYFLEFFGLKSLGDLPTLREFSELTEESRVLFERRMGEPLELNDASATFEGGAVPVFGDEDDELADEGGAELAEDAESAGDRLDDGEPTPERLDEHESEHDDASEGFDELEPDSRDG
jgi:segregation and condensation protein B